MNKKASKFSMLSSVQKTVSYLCGSKNCEELFDFSHLTKPAFFHSHVLRLQTVFEAYAEIYLWKKYHQSISMFEKKYSAHVISRLSIPNQHLFFSVIFYSIGACLVVILFACVVMIVLIR